jgi:hypothetical protein
MRGKHVPRPEDGVEPMDANSPCMPEWQWIFADGGVQKCGERWGKLALIPIFQHLIAQPERSRRGEPRGMRGKRGARGDIEAHSTRGVDEP